MKGSMRQDLYQELFEIEDSHWWHQHKRAVVHQMIRKFAKKGRVLDVGAGTGKILEELQRKGWEIIGIDGEKEAITWSKKRGVIVKQVDINREKLPFSDNRFDLILALDFLEHISDEKRALKKMKRVLKEDGIIIATVPAYQWLYSYWDRMLGHQRRYSRRSLNRLFNKASFKIAYSSHFFCLNLLPTLLVRTYKKLLGQATQGISDFQTSPFSIISIPLLRLYGRLERLAIPHLKLPFGLSMILVARKL